MKSIYTLFAFFVALAAASCSSAYRTGQTPDDLYYSPAKEVVQGGSVSSNNNDNAQYDDYVANTDDRYLRMKVANHYRWNAIDDYTYWNDSRYDYYGSPFYYNNWNFNPGYNNFGYNSFNNFYGYSPYYGNFLYGNGFYGNNFYGSYGSYYNPSFYGNYGGFYSPYTTVINYKNRPRGSNFGSNLSSFRNNNYNNANYSTPRSNNTIRRTYPSNGGSGSTTVDRPARTFAPSTAPSSNTGGSSGGYNSSGSSSTAPRSGRG